MPRNVRNFWIELDVDGSKSQVATGPRSADGGFTPTILQRSEGDIIRALDVRGFVRSSDGKLILEASSAYPEPPGASISVTTDR